MCTQKHLKILEYNIDEIPLTGFIGGSHFLVFLIGLTVNYITLTINIVDVISVNWITLHFS